MFETVVSGLVIGAAYASLGLCVTLLARMGGVVNFAQTAIGLLGSYVVLVLCDLQVPVWVAASIGVLVGGLVGAFSGVIMARWFKDADVGVRSSAAIALMIGYLSIGTRIFGDRPRPSPPLFDGPGISLGGVYVSNGLLVSLAVSILLAVALNRYINRSHTGIKLQAFAAKPVTAELIGIPSSRLTVLIWSMAGCISALAMLIIMASSARNANYISLSLLIIPALCAALIGAFSSFYTTLLGGLLLGIFEAAALSWSSTAPYAQTIYLPVIVLILCWTKRKDKWDGQRA
ncbi:branched-chain amino acid ABC transporter permease [Pseudomonas sp. LRF_L74]|uniref:branched-chain amino acid ABC transporter permease n=1 Tax=Pseudomonas sp. LRF_L74 TaxID=3369422 RepID=UPI003F5E5DCA